MNPSQLSRLSGKIGAFSIRRNIYAEQGRVISIAGFEYDGTERQCHQGESARNRGAHNDSASTTSRRLSENK
jgi:hypothetical protein